MQIIFNTEKKHRNIYRMNKMQKKMMKKINKYKNTNRTYFRRNFMRICKMP